jgi:hypothetical protein
MVETQAWENDEIQKGLANVRATFEDTDALSALLWMRRGCSGAMTGTPAVLADAGQSLLLALAATTDSRSLRVLGTGNGFTVELTDRYIEFAYWPARPSGYVVAEEEARIDRRATEGHYQDASRPVLHLCLDPDGPLPSPAVAGNLIEVEEEGDLIDPSMAHEWLSVRGVLEGGRTPALV